MEGLVISESTLGAAPVVALEGELNISTAPALRRVLVRLIKKGALALVLDLRNLRSMDTSGLATLVETRMNLSKKDGRLVLLGLDEKLQEVFHIAGVNGLFEMAQNEQAARELLQTPSGE